MEIKRFLMHNMNRLFNVAHAEEVVEGVKAEGGQAEVKEPQPTVNFEQLIAKARQEEKEKLYPQIERLKAENASLVQKVNDYLLKIAEKDEKISSLEKELETLKANPNITEEYKTLKEEVERLRRENEELKNTYEQKLTAIELEYYKKEKIAEANGKIIPELVTGNTKEEIDNSIELAKKRYEEIVSSVAKVGTPTTNLPPVNPKNTNTQSFSDLNLEDLMRMSSKEWAEVRKKLGL